MEGFHYLFHPVTRRALELAGDGTLGDITHVEVRMAMPEPSDSDPRWSLELGGGALMDLGCYGLHVMRQLGIRRSCERTPRSTARASTRGAMSSLPSQAAQQA